MANSYLSLWLEGSMQSWGEDSKHSRKDTLNFPTKSAVLGILLSSMGRKGEQVELLAELAPLDLQVFAFAKPNSNSGILTDFHMVGSNYDLTDGWQAKFLSRKFDGSRANGGTKLTLRSYLQDACFGVVIEVPQHLSEEIIAGLKEPVYDVYLGRKSCPPTDFIFKGVFNSLDSAQVCVLDVAEQKEKELRFKVLQGEHGPYDSLKTLNDLPVSFGVKKKYMSRVVTIV